MKKFISALLSAAVLLSGQTIVIPADCADTAPVSEADALKQFSIMYESELIAQGYSEADAFRQFSNEVYYDILLEQGYSEMEAKWIANYIFPEEYFSYGRPRRDDINELYIKFKEEHGYEFSKMRNMVQEAVELDMENIGIFLRFFVTEERAVGEKYYEQLISKGYSEEEAEYICFLNQSYKEHLCANSGIEDALLVCDENGEPYHFSEVSPDFIEEYLGGQGYFIEDDLIYVYNDDYKNFYKLYREAAIQELYEQIIAEIRETADISDEQIIRIDKENNSDEVRMYVKLNAEQIKKAAEIPVILDISRYVDDSEITEKYPESVEEFLDLVISETPDLSDGGAFYVKDGRYEFDFSGFYPVLRIGNIPEEYLGKDITELISIREPSRMSIWSYDQPSIGTYMNKASYNGVILLNGASITIRIETAVRNTLPSGYDDLVSASRRFDYAPYIFDELTPADANGDGRITPTDAGLILSGYAATSTGEAQYLNKTIFDCDGDGLFSPKDASIALGYYTALSTLKPGTSLTWDEYLANEINS